MKRIVKQTEAKLRLRGMGSGYFEGAGQKESSEPLQLCVSCTNGEHYKSAVRQVEDLLKRVYEEYKAFCRENNKPFPDLAINFSENQLVYSASRSAMGPNTLANDSDDGDGGDMSGSPKKERRSRRSRTKGGSSKMPSGDDDRGEPGPNAPPVEEIEKMIDMRNEARRACNFAEADRLREALHTQGVALMDEPGGRGRGAEVTTWRYWRD
jgi:cysteinyl-tRNA synthetase